MCGLKDSEFFSGVSVISFSHFNYWGIMSFWKHPGGLLSHVWSFFVDFSSTVWWIFFLGFGFGVFFCREKGFYTSCLPGLWVFVDSFPLGLWSTHLPRYSKDRQPVTVTEVPLWTQLILKCSKRTWYFQLHPQEDAKTEKVGYSWNECSRGFKATGVHY